MPRRQWWWLALAGGAGLAVIFLVLAGLLFR
jgi:hypothetical protein